MLEKLPETFNDNRKKDLKRWNTSQAAWLMSERTTKRIAEWSGKKEEEINDFDRAKYLLEEGSERFREENKDNPEFYQNWPQAA